MKRANVVLMLLVALVYSAIAQKPAIVTSNEPGWQKIGETTASFAMQDESIAVYGSDQFDAIKLRVTDAPINIESMQVVYESGEVQEVDVKSKLQAGEETRVIDLDRQEEIENVSFTYQTAENYRGEKAHVELHGLKPGGESNSDTYRNEKAEETESDLEAAGEDAERELREAEEETESAADKTGDKISEAAANTAAGVKDKVYTDKVGPDGQKVYIDKHAKYYYINDEGNKVYISKSQLKDKPAEGDN